MNLKLFFEAILKFILGIILVGLLIFIPANTINYWNGWLFMGLLFIPMFIAGVVMMIKSPNLLRSRLNAKEKESEQKDYTEWQNDDTMIEVDRAVSWGWASCGPEDSQITPDEGFDILQKNGKLATQLVDAKRNGRTAKYNELMTELYERIRK